MTLQIAFVSYGHRRHEKHKATPLNSVLLTNAGAFRGLRKVGKVTDYSPEVGTAEHGDIQWDAVGRIAALLQPADLLYCQASVSLDAIQVFRDIAPGKPIILQRDSTHAMSHLNLVRAGMDRNNVGWEHQYERDSHALLNRELAEYVLVDYIFVLSEWVRSTFVQQGLEGKVRQFSSQLVDPSLWHVSQDELLKRDALPFTVVHPAQLGVRKGTFELLEAWREFWPGHTSSKLVLCGAPEHGMPEHGRKKLAQAIAQTPACQSLGWVPMTAMREVYARAHALVMPSWEDGSTCTGPEAALCRLAIIATPNAGIDSLLEEEPVGHTVVPGDPGSIVKALAAAYRDRAETARRGARAYAFQRDLGIDQYAENVAASVRKVLT